MVRISIHILLHNLHIGIVRASSPKTKTKKNTHTQSERKKIHEKSSVCCSTPRGSILVCCLARSKNTNNNQVWRAGGWWWWSSGNTGMSYALIPLFTSLLYWNKMFCAAYLAAVQSILYNIHYTHTAVCRHCAMYSYPRNDCRSHTHFSRALHSFAWHENGAACGCHGKRRR